MAEDVPRAAATTDKGKADMSMGAHYEQVCSQVGDPVKQQIHDAKVLHNHRFRFGIDSMGCKVACYFGAG